MTVIHHVALETRRADVEACVAFWALLGFSEVDPPEGLRDIATWVEREGEQVHLLYADEPGVPRQAHLAIVCPDYEATVAALRDAGHEVVPGRAHWGAPRCSVRDPAGHRVEVMERPPA